MEIQNSILIRHRVTGKIARSKNEIILDGESQNSMTGVLVSKVEVTPTPQKMTCED